jgi:hypothetical protein
VPESGERLQQGKKDFVHSPPGILRVNLYSVDRHGVLDHLFSHLEKPPLRSDQAARAAFHPSANPSLTASFTMIAGVQP